MYARRRSWLAVLLASLVGLVSCATARNYEDPSGPILIGPTVAPRPSGGDVRLVTFNIKFARHVDRAIDLLSRPGPLRGADVLVLQEMDGPGTETLARQLNLNFVYVPSAVHPASHRDFGVAILSPWAIDAARKILLPHLHRTRKMRRAAAVATVHSPSGAVRVYAVHLETPFGASASARRDQARTIAADAAGWAGPVVVAGDFNGAAGADELARAGYTWLTRDVHNTSGLFDVDHILVRGLCAGRTPAAAKAADPTRASDHVPVWAVVRTCT